MQSLKALWKLNLTICDTGLGDLEFISFKLGELNERGHFGNIQKKIYLNFLT